MNTRNEHKKKALIVASVGRFFEFERNNIAILQKKGYSIDLAANFVGLNCDDFDADGVNKIQVNFTRSPFSATSFVVYKELRKLFSREKYSLIHCHTPNAAVLVRLAATKTRSSGTKVIYTAHGFHFYKGAPLLNWLLYFPVEYFCSKLTDCLITINKEDFKLAKRHFKCTNVKYVPGVGIDLQKYNPWSCGAKKNNEKPISLISIGELSERKNHQFVIEQLKKVDFPVIYDIIGEGDKLEKLDSLIRNNGLDHQIRLLGRKENISEILKDYDIFLFPSKQEGLPVALMEAMAMEMPVLASNIRGNRDLIPKDNLQLFDLNKPDELLSKINILLDPSIRIKLGKGNRKRLKPFSRFAVSQMMNRIYEEVLNG